MRSILYLVILAACFSCKKDHLYGIKADKPDVQLLVGKKWQTTSINEKLDNTSSGVDEFPSLPDYKKDDYIFISSDSTYEINDNELLRPGILTSFIDAGTWKYFPYDQYIQLISSFGEIRHPAMKIISLTESELKAEVEDDNKIKYFTYKPMQ
jgi:hypothetical protein